MRHRHRKITIEDFEGFEASSLVASSGDRKIHAIVVPNEGIAYYRVTWSKDEFRDFPIDKFRQAINYYNTGEVDPLVLTDATIAELKADLQAATGSQSPVEFSAGPEGICLSQSDDDEAKLWTVFSGNWGKTWQGKTQGCGVTTHYREGRDIQEAFGAVTSHHIKI